MWWLNHAKHLDRHARNELSSFRVDSFRVLEDVACRAKEMMAKQVCSIGVRPLPDLEDYMKCLRDAQATALEAVCKEHFHIGTSDTEHFRIDASDQSDVKSSGQ